MYRFQIEHWFRAPIDSKSGIGRATHIRRRDTDLSSPPYPAKALLTGLLDALMAIRTTTKGYPVAQRLLQVPVPPYDGQAACQQRKKAAAQPKQAVWAFGRIM